jgi:hypothetical protein
MAHSYQVAGNPFIDPPPVPSLIQELRSSSDSESEDDNYPNRKSSDTQNSYCSAYEGTYSPLRSHWKEKSLANEFRPVVRTSNEVDDVRRSWNEKLLDENEDPSADDKGDNESFYSVSVYSTPEEEEEEAPEIPAKSPHRAQQSHDSGISISSEANRKVTNRKEMYRIEAFAAEFPYLPTSYTVEALQVASQRVKRRKATSIQQCKLRIHGLEVDGDSEPRRTSTELLLEYDSADEKTQKQILREVEGRDRELNLLREYARADLKGKQRILEGKLAKIENGARSDWRKVASSMGKEKRPFEDPEKAPISKNMLVNQGNQTRSSKDPARKRASIMSALHKKEENQNPLAGSTEKRGNTIIQNLTSDGIRFKPETTSSKQKNSFKYPVSQSYRFEASGTGGDQGSETEDTFQDPPPVVTKIDMANAVKDTIEQTEKEPEPVKTKRGLRTLWRKKQKNLFADPLPNTDAQKRVGKNSLEDRVEEEKPAEVAPEKKKGFLRRTLTKLMKDFAKVAEKVESKTSSIRESLDKKRKSFEKFGTVAYGYQDMKDEEEVMSQQLIREERLKSGRGYQEEKELEEKLWGRN